MANEAYKIVVTIDGNDQISATLDKTNQKLRETSQASDKAADSGKSFGEAWGVSAAGLLAASAVIGTAIVQLNALGTQANAAEKTFNQVTGGAEEAAASLARMRQATGGIIDDMTLMKGASSLLVTGIAQTNEQAEELVNLGSRLSSVMGVDAAEGIQNLNSALLNNSFMRLDTLGISAAAVRERVNELKDAGMDMSAAFSQAVLEIGTQTLEDLGDAAAVGETAVARLATAFTNLGQDIAQGVNVQLESAAVALEQLIILGDLALGGTGGLPALEAEAAQYAELMALATDYKTRREEVFTSEGYSITSSGLSNQEALTFQQSQGEMFPELSSGTYFQDAFDSLDPTKINDARMALTLLRPEWAALTDEQLRMYALDIDNTFRAVADAQEGLAGHTRVATEAQAEQTAQLQAETDAMIEYERQIAAMNEEMLAVDNVAGIRGMGQGLDASAQAGSFGGGFFDPEQLAGVQMQTEAIVAEYERLKELGESSEFTLVSELEVERAREITESANATAEQSERNAAAWEKASLAMIAGASGGGRENEFNQRVLAGIEDPEQRAALERQMNLNSGVENANTDVLGYGEELVTSITNEQGIAAGAEAAETYVKAFEDGIMAGLSGEDLKTYIEGEVGYALSGEAGSSGAEITVQSGEGYIALAERTGYTREELEAANGGGMLLAGQVINMPDGSALIAIGESTTPEDAANNILAGAFTQTGAGMSETMPMGTTYDPATGTYNAQPPDAVMGGEGSLFPSEESEAVSMLAEDMLSIETSMTNISAIDISEPLDPFIGDMLSANTELDTFEAGMTRLTETEFSLEVPIAFVFDTQTAETLSRNSQVVEVVKLILPMLGYPVE